jgi:hypothetical protein
MALVSDIITEAFIDLAEITVGRLISVPEQTDAFLRLNQMLLQWSLEQLMVYTVEHDSLSLTAGTASYTVGTGGSLASTANPVRITGASSVAGNFLQAMRLMSFAEFTAELKDDLGAATVLATALAADNAWPSINIRVYPMPAPNPGTLLLDYWTALTAFTAVTETVNLPPGFEDALHFNLALRLYPEYVNGGTPPLAVVEGNARSSKMAIVALNAQINAQRVDSMAAPQRAPQEKAA